MTVLALAVLLVVRATLISGQARPQELIHRSSGTATAGAGTSPGSMSWTVVASQITGKINFTFEGPSNKYMALGFGKADMIQLHALIGYSGGVRQEYYTSYDDCANCNTGATTQLSNNVIQGTSNGNTPFRRIVFERPLDQGTSSYNFSKLFDPPADPCNPTAPTIVGCWVVGDMEGNEVGEHGTNCGGTPQNQCFGSGGGATLVFQDPTLAIDPTTVSKFIPRTKLGQSSIYMSAEITTTDMIWTLEGPTTDYWSVATGASMSDGSGLAYTTGVSGECSTAPNVCEYYYNGILASNCIKHSGTAWTILFAGALNGVFVINASRPLAKPAGSAVDWTTRHELTFQDPTMTVIWAMKSGLAMTNHGASLATRSVEILGYGQRLPSGAIIQPQTAQLPESCTAVSATGGGGNITQGADGRISIKNGELTILFKANGTDQVYLEMVGPDNKYISVGWNHVNFSNGVGSMNQAGAVANTNNGFGNYFLDGYGPNCCPTHANPWTTIERTVAGGTVTVKATRAMVTSDPRDFHFNVSNPDIALIWATGNGAGSMAMADHGTSNRDTIPHNWVTGVANTSAVNLRNTITTTGGGGGAAGGGGRFTVAGGAFSFVHKLSADGQNIELEMTGPSTRYFSVGWNAENSLPSATMVNGDAVASTGATWNDYWMTDYSSGCCPPDGTNSWTEVSRTEVNGVVTLSITRPLRTSKATDFQFDVASPNIALLWAIGRTGTTSMSNHGVGANARGAFSFNFVSGGSSETLVKPIYTIEEHASLMMVAFAVFIPVAIMLHRHQWHPLLRTYAPAGQQLHRVVNCLAIMLAWCGFMIQLGYLRGFTGRTTHGILGLTVILAATLQGIYGMAGFYNKHDFFLPHRIFGFIVMLAGLLNCVLGAFLWNNLAFTVIFFIVLVGVSIAFCTLEILGRNEQDLKGNTWIEFDRRSDPPEHLEKMALAANDAKGVAVEGIPSTSVGTLPRQV